MDSPRSRAYKVKVERTHIRRKHLNAKFYSSKEWRQARKAYLDNYQHTMQYMVSNGYYVIANRAIQLKPYQQTYILSFDKPCEICLKLYIAGAYDTIEEGAELDHIIPINPDNAMQSCKHGDLFDQDNMQWLCKRHHSRKSQRETNNTKT